MSNQFNIANVDPYMNTQPANENGIVFHSPFEENFRLAGSAFQHLMDHRFRRLPFEPVVSPNVDVLAWYTAGMQLQFKSNSQRVVIKAELVYDNIMHHMPSTGSSGFDIYIGGPGNWRQYSSTVFQPPTKEYSVEIFNRPEPGMREFLINFPLYNCVNSVWIGLDDGAEILPPSPWSCNQPTVVYGTSITQGGCASHPGGAWTNILSRWHNCEFYNFGFSGNGKGEPAAAEVLASIPDPRCYILDYEANSHEEGIKSTLDDFLNILRSKHPTVPILVISKAPHKSMLSFGANDSCDEINPSSGRSRQYQMELIAKRQAAGDNNLHFINGLNLLGMDWDECMMDGCHFNDLGFYRFAENLNKYLQF